MAGSEDPARERKPEGCICTVEWTGDGDNEFSWSYKSQCPVALKDHPLYCLYFQKAFDWGYGWAMAPSGGAIRIDDGGKRHDPPFGR
ncbi:hypothetical protein BHE90_017570 [Fusarium euwallaceae]|nr:hypothetical protein BHE90_017570 [Fusarium euwallaceae]